MVCPPVKQCLSIKRHSSKIMHPDCYEILIFNSPWRGWKSICNLTISNMKASWMSSSFPWIRLCHRGQFPISDVHTTDTFGQFHYKIAFAADCISFALITFHWHIWFLLWRKMVILAYIGCHSCISMHKDEDRVLSNVGGRSH